MPDLEDLTSIELADYLVAVSQRRSILPTPDYLSLINKANRILETENPRRRPRDDHGMTGGLIRLDPSIPSLILPDLHARRFFLKAVLFSEATRGLEKLSQGDIQIVCVGDCFHGEARVIRRWLGAYQEYLSGYSIHRHMDQEMTESLGTMEMVMALKIRFPENFHFLKGNHENVSNENGGGNYPFVKFVEEGAMVSDYVKRFLGQQFMKSYYRLEKNFPLFAIGRNFLVSHAEPYRYFSENELVGYRGNADVVEGLTWTDNNAAQTGSVSAMLDQYVKNITGISYYFGGHRPISDRFRTRAEGRYVQIHNPEAMNVAFLSPHADIGLERDVIQLEGCL